jgi:hypothetical protein
MAPVRRLVRCLRRLGVTSPAGLQVVSEHWADISLTDETHWQEARRVNRAIVDELINRRISSDEATPEDGDFLVAQWPFPMGDLDLSERAVDLTELEAERDRWSPNF